MGETGARRELRSAIRLAECPSRTDGGWLVHAQVVDKSITTKMLRPAREWIVTFVPPSVAPAVLSLTALLCVIQAWYMCTLYSDNFPRASSFGAIALGTVFWVLHSIQSLHARKHRQETPVTELFGYVTDNLATVFLMQVFCMLLNVESLELRWYIVQVGQLVLMRKHIEAFVRGGGVQHRMLTGPGEAMCLYLIVIGVRGTLGLEWLGQIYLRAWVAVVGFCSRIIGELPVAVDDPWQVAHDSVVAIYILNVVHTFIEIGLVGSEKKGAHKETRFGLLVCMMVRVFPAVAFRFLGDTHTQHGLIYDGIFMTVITADICVAKMAKRELHPWIVCMAMASIFNHFVILVLTLIYYAVVFADICHYMNLPLLSCCRNVYCDGVYDLCHIGHKNAFRKALGFGNRLFVGIMGDADCAT